MALVPPQTPPGLPLEKGLELFEALFGIYLIHPLKALTFVSNIMENQAL